MPTLMRKTTLWAGPADGEIIHVNRDDREYFVPGPLKMTPQNVILGEEANVGGETYVGRYDLNPLTGRFEWKGYE